MLLEYFLPTSTVCSILILTSEEKQRLVQWAAFPSCSHLHWCHDQSFTCIVEFLAVNRSELMEIGKVVVSKKQIKKIALSQEQEVSVQ